MFFPAAVQLFQQEVALNVLVAFAGIGLQFVQNAAYQLFALFPLGQGGVFGQHAVQIEDFAQAGHDGLARIGQIVGRGVVQRTVGVVQHVAQELVEHRVQIALDHEFAAQGVDDLALLVHDVVVIQQGFADLEVVGFHPLLGPFHGAGDHGVFNGFAVAQAQLFHEALDPVRAEQAHQVVFQREVEAGGAGVALAARTAAQLVVDAAAFMALGAQDVQAAQVHHAVAQHDVRAASGHVGGNGHLALLTGLGHDFGFLLVLFGVEHVVRDAQFGQALGEHFRGFNGDGAHQHGLFLPMQLDNGLHNGVEFFLAATEDQVRVVPADHGLVGRDGNDFQVVDLLKFHGFGVGRAGHARKFVVQAEIVLEGDGGQGLVFRRDGYVLLGFQGLVQAVGIAASGHEAAGELVHDDHLIVLHDVVHVALEDLMGLEGLQNVVLGCDVGRVKEVVQFEQFFAT